MSPLFDPLLHFIRKQAGSKKTPILFSDESKKMFKTLYEKIKQAETEWIREGYRSVKSKSGLITKTGKTISKTIGHRYIPLEIRDFLDSTNTHFWESNYNFNANGRHYSIITVLPRTSAMTKDKIGHFFENALHKIYLWLSVIDSIAYSHCGQNVKIYLYFTDFLKLLPDTRGHSLDWIHSNTAFTSSCIPSADIVIFRKEEWFKVFIHETFHTMGLDFSDMMPHIHKRGDQELCHIFPHLKNVKELRIYESYNETWAELINVLFIAHFTTQYENKPPHFDTVFQKMERMVYYEAHHSLFQCAKILHHYKLTYAEIIDLDPSKIKPYTENTHIFAYYVVKAILMFQAEGFIQWCLKHNTENVLQFNKTDQNIFAFCHLIKRLYNTPEFLESIHRAETIFSDEEKQKIPQNVAKTLRMSLFDM